MAKSKKRLYIVGVHMDYGDFAYAVVATSVVEAFNVLEATFRVNGDLDIRAEYDLKKLPKVQVELLGGFAE